MKKWRLLKKMTRKSQGSGSSDYNNGNFNEYDNENYEKDCRAPKWLTSCSHQKGFFLLSLV